MSTFSQRLASDTIAYNDNFLIYYKYNCKLCTGTFLLDLSEEQFETNRYRTIQDIQSQFSFYSCSENGSLEDGHYKTVDSLYRAIQQKSLFT